MKTLALIFRYLIIFQIRRGWLIQKIHGTTPPVINGDVASMGSFSMAAVQLGLIFIGTLIYYPFFKMYDNKILEEEKAYENN